VSAPHPPAHRGNARETRERPDVETASAAYARRFAGPVGEWMLAVQTSALRELLTPWPAARVLDVGGGHAQVAVPLAAADYQVTVTGSAAACRARLARLLADGDATFVLATPMPLPFADASFDVAVALRLLTHVEDWRALLRELCRVARFAVVVDFPESHGIHRLAAPLFRWKLAVEGNTRPYLAMRTAEVAAELAEQGFTDALARPQLFLPMALHRALGRAAVSRSLEAVARSSGLTRALGSPVLLRGTRRL
jgi:SAM-dependent methyltransferase